MSVFGGGLVEVWGGLGWFGVFQISLVTHDAKGKMRDIRQILFKVGEYKQR